VHDSAEAEKARLVGINRIGLNAGELADRSSTRSPKRCPPLPPARELALPRLRAATSDPRSAPTPGPARAVLVMVGMLGRAGERTAMISATTSEVERWRR
jgi:hypothetical protein